LVADSVSDRNEKPAKGRPVGGAALDGL